MEISGCASCEPLRAAQVDVVSPFAAAAEPAVDPTREQTQAGTSDLRLASLDTLLPVATPGESLALEASAEMPGILVTLAAAASGAASATPPANESKGGAASTPADAVSDRTAEAVRDAPEEREEFTGLRIEARCVPAAHWAQEIRGRGRTVLPFSRLVELAGRRPQGDRVVIGVLYERQGSQQLANGESFACWGLTDLAKPRPRHLLLHLRGQAFVHWRTGQAAAGATRGSVMALLNPVIVQEGGSGGGATAHPVARVERAAQIFKLGNCPTLGTCCIRHCQQPCNASDGSRFCQVHMGVAYSMKPVRNLTGGIDAATAALLKSCPGAQKRARRPPPELEPEEASEDAVEDAKRLKTDMAMVFNARRLHHSDAKDSYVRSILAGARPDREALSHVPVLGRGLESAGGIEMDFSTMATDDKLKAERILANHMERARPASAAELPEPSASSLSAPSRPLAFPARGAIAKRARADGPGALGKPEREQGKEPASKRALGELMQALTERRMARRSGTAADARRVCQELTAAGLRRMASDSVTETKISEVPGAEGIVAEAQDRCRMPGAPSAAAVAAAAAAVATAGEPLPPDALVPSPFPGGGGAATKDWASPESEAPSVAGAGTHDQHGGSHIVDPLTGASLAEAPLADKNVCSALVADNRGLDLARSVISDLASADSARLEEALVAAGQLSVEALAGATGQELYMAVGRLSMGGRADIRSLALRVRRQLRAVSHAAAEKTSRPAALAPEAASLGPLGA